MLYIWKWQLNPKIQVIPWSCWSDLWQHPLGNKYVHGFISHGIIWYYFSVPKNDLVKTLPHMTESIKVVKTINGLM